MASMKTIATVHYREMPEELLKFVSSNNDVSIVKDGVLRNRNGASPRISIFWNGTKDIPRKLMRDLTTLLQNLQNSDQIVSYTTKD